MFEMARQEEKQGRSTSSGSVTGDNIRGEGRRGESRGGERSGGEGVLRRSKRRRYLPKIRTFK